jgi:SAM-dependent MidA family methyltransferase
MASVAERLRLRIAEQGSVTFAEFMEEALYGDGGYYAREDLPIGIGGDYVTGSSFSPLFGRSTARLLRRLDEVLGRPADLLEAGYGSGTHLQAVAEALGRPLDRRLLGWERVPRLLAPPLRSISSLQALETARVHGVVFSYELFDALPVHRLVRRASGEIGELWVEVGADDEFRFREGRLSEPGLKRLLGRDAESLGVGQIADLSPGWRPLYRRLAEILDVGVLVTCDYGFERQRLLDLRVRKHGTLACYRRHSVHRDPLQAVGEQDLTAHVDFTALRRQGESSGLQTVALTRQIQWLGACGIFEDLEGAEQSTRLEAMTLLDAAGMGEEIRVLVQVRGLDPATVLDLGMLA